MGMKEGTMSTALLPQETWGRKLAHRALRGAWDAPATDPSRTKALGTGTEAPGNRTPTQLHRLGSQRL